MSERGEDWFTTVYHTHYGQIVNYGRRRRLDADGAAELAQEVFIVAWRRRTDVPAHSLPWLYGVARRLLANSRRAAPLPVPVPDLGHLVDPPSVDAEADVGLVEVRAALAGLSEPDQEILRLVGWEELTVSEAAVVLGCTRATAAVRLHRARRRLVAALARTRS